MYTVVVSTAPPQKTWNLWQHMAAKIKHWCSVTTTCLFEAPLPWKDNYKWPFPHELAGDKLWGEEKYNHGSTIVNCSSSNALLRQNQKVS